MLFHCMRDVLVKILMLHNKIMYLISLKAIFVVLLNYLFKNSLDIMQNLPKTVFVEE